MLKCSGIQWHQWFLRLFSFCITMQYFVEFDLISFFLHRFKTLCQYLWKCFDKSIIGNGLSGLVHFLIYFVACLFVSHSASSKWACRVCFFFIFFLKWAVRISLLFHYDYWQSDDMCYSHHGFECTELCATGMVTL